MVELKVFRIDNDERGCRGVFQTPWFNYVSLERPWLDNKHGISCILAGKYKCAWVDTATAGNLNGKTIGILDVPGRENIRIHAGNTIKDSEGCILLGFLFHPVEKMIDPKSRAAMYRFLTSMLDAKEITIEITNLFKEGV